MDYLPPPGELLNTNSTQAILPKVPGRIGTEMIVAPDNIGLERTYTFHDFGLQIWHGTSPLTSISSAEEPGPSFSGKFPLIRNLFREDQ